MPRLRFARLQFSMEAKRASRVLSMRLGGTRTSIGTAAIYFKNFHCEPHGLIKWNDVGEELKVHSATDHCSSSQISQNDAWLVSTHRWRQVISTVHRPLPYRLERLPARPEHVPADFPIQLFHPQSRPILQESAPGPDQLAALYPVRIVHVLDMLTPADIRYPLYRGQPLYAAKAGRSRSRSDGAGSAAEF